MLTTNLYLFYPKAFMRSLFFLIILLLVTIPTHNLGLPTGGSVSFNVGLGTGIPNIGVSASTGAASSAASSTNSLIASILAAAQQQANQIVTQAQINGTLPVVNVSANASVHHVNNNSMNISQKGLNLALGHTIKTANASSNHSHQVGGHVSHGGNISVNVSSNTNSLVASILAAAQKQAGNIAAQSTASVGVPSVNVSINGIRKNLSNSSNNVSIHQVKNKSNFSINATNSVNVLIQQILAAAQAQANQIVISAQTNQTHPTVNITHPNVSISKIFNHKPNTSNNAPFVNLVNYKPKTVNASFRLVHKALHPVIFHHVNISAVNNSANVNASTNVSASANASILIQEILAAAQAQANQIVTKADLAAGIPVVNITFNSSYTANQSLNSSLHSNHTLQTIFNTHHKQAHHHKGSNYTLRFNKTLNVNGANQTVVNASVNTSSLIAQILAAAQAQASQIVTRADIKAGIPVNVSINSTVQAHNHIKNVHPHLLNITYNISQINFNHSHKVHKHHLNNLKHSINKTAVNTSQSINVNLSAYPTIASILAAAQKQANLIITQAQAVVNHTVNVSANLSAIHKHHVNISKPNANITLALGFNNSVGVNSSNVLGAAQSLASLIFAEAHANHHHKVNISYIISQVHHNISHAQNISYNLTVNSSVANIIAAAQARALESLAHAKHHIKIHHHNKTHTNISAFINQLHVHVNHSKLGVAVHKARAEFAKKFNTSAENSSISILSNAEKLVSLIYSEAQANHTHVNATHVNNIASANAQAGEGITAASALLAEAETNHTHNHSHIHINISHNHSAEVTAAEGLAETLFKENKAHHNRSRNVSLSGVSIAEDFFNEVEKIVNRSKVNISEVEQNVSAAVNHHKLNISEVGINLHHKVNISAPEVHIKVPHLHNHQHHVNLSEIHVKLPHFNLNISEVHHHINVSKVHAAINNSEEVLAAENLAGILYKQDEHHANISKIHSNISGQANAGVVLANTLFSENELSHNVSHKVHVAVPNISEVAHHHVSAHHVNKAVHKVFAELHKKIQAIHHHNSQAGHHHNVQVNVSNELPKVNLPHNHVSKVEVAINNNVHHHVSQQNGQAVIHKIEANITQGINTVQNHAHHAINKVQSAHHAVHKVKEVHHHVAKAHKASNVSTAEVNISSALSFAGKLYDEDLRPVHVHPPHINATVAKEIAANVQNKIAAQKPQIIQKPTEIEKVYYVENAQVVNNAANVENAGNVNRALNVQNEKHANSQAQVQPLIHGHAHSHVSAHANQTSLTAQIIAKAQATVKSVETAAKAHIKQVEANITALATENAKLEKEIAQLESENKTNQANEARKESAEKKAEAKKISSAQKSAVAKLEAKARRIVKQHAPHKQSRHGHKSNSTQWSAQANSNKLSASNNQWSSSGNSNSNWSSSSNGQSSSSSSISAQTAAEILKLLGAQTGKDIDKRYFNITSTRIISGGYTSD